MIKILVIEDETDLRDGILELLEIEGFEAIAAENGLIGTELAQSELPDLILCDVMMPNLDGYGVLSTLRQNSLTAAIPFIFLTAKAAKADWRQGMELGADDYLTKPFTGEELLGAIAARLAKREVIVHRYTTALDEATKTLSQSAYYDTLTGLPNRLLLGERFQQAIAQLSERNLPVPILCLDLDQFRRINNTLGYAYGDRLLKLVVQRLQSLFTSQDTIAHLSSDQFSMIPVSWGTEPAQVTDWRSSIARLAQDLLYALAQPFTLENHTVFLTASIGIAFSTQDGSDVETLVRNADIAMNEAKRQGGNRYLFYTTAPTTNTSDQLALEADLRAAIERSELRVYYQPQIALSTNRIQGAEALIRWQHPQRGMISPAEFIPLAESTGLIVEIGEWVLATACRQILDWRNDGFDGLQIAVNLSARQFNQTNLCQAIARVLAETNLDPTLLDLELTESILVHDVEGAITTLKELRSTGAQVSLDDFGTGYSSLSYLQRFPFNTLKIDRCFVRDINQEPKNAAITTAIIEMAHQLQLQVIAEGVETQAELDFLREHNCDAVQGYFFSPPVPAAKFSQLLQVQS